MPAATQRTTPLLSASQPHVVGREVERIAGDLVEALDAAMPVALAAQPEDVRAYLDAYRELTDRILAVLWTDERPAWLTAALQQQAMSMPFTDWVGTYGPGKGAAIALVGAIRSLLPHAKPLPHPTRRKVPSWVIDGDDAVRFYRAVVNELERGTSPLDQIASAWQLNRTELARLFGVRRQALDKWDAAGVPGVRQSKAATLGAIADVLARRLKGDRIAATVRRPAPAYGGRSIIDAIAAGDEELVLEELRQAFDWSSAA